MDGQPLWSLPESLQELVDAGDQELVEEILSVFQTDTAERLIRLASAARGQGRNEIRLEAHAIKGSAGQVGATDLAATCKQLELQASDAPMEALERMVQQAEVQFRAVSKAMIAARG